jgi:hypothetical protein
MTVPGGQPGFGPPAAGDEVATLLGGLEQQRATFAWKVPGLDSRALAARRLSKTQPRWSGDDSVDRLFQRAGLRG